MKRRVTQVTKISKTVDNRLKVLEKKLKIIEGYINLLEKTISEKSPVKSVSKKSSFTYTIKKQVKNQ